MCSDVAQPGAGGLPGIFPEYIDDADCGTGDPLIVFARVQITVRIPGCGCLAPLRKNLGHQLPAPAPGTLPQAPIGEGMGQQHRRHLEPRGLLTDLGAPPGFEITQQPAKHNRHGDTAAVQLVLPLIAQPRRRDDRGAASGLVDRANQLDGDTGLAHAHFVGQHDAVFANALGQRQHAGALALVQVRSRLTLFARQLLLLRHPPAQGRRNLHPAEVRPCHIATPKGNALPSFQ